MNLEFAVREKFVPLWETGPEIRYIILMGGRGAGRSTGASQYIVSRLFSEEYMRGAMMRAIHSDIRHSIWREVNDRIDEQGIKSSLHITENDMGIRFGKNSIQAHGFKASSSSNSAKLKSLANYNTVAIEEAEEIGEGEFMKLDDSLRTTKGSIKIILCLNSPPKSHWIIKRWFNLEKSDTEGFYIPVLKPEMKKDTVFLYASYLDNLPNLDEHTLQRYQGYEQLKPNYYHQMIEGLVPEVVRGKIYNGWSQIEGIPDGARLVRRGIDFGWFPDPACVVDVYYYNGGYILDELAYGTELSNEYLASCISEDDKGVLTIADSAEPKSIDDISNYGVNIEGSAKGADSVNFGIQVVAQKRIMVTKRSKNIWTSYENYAWKENKDGEPTGEPDHTFSHAMDAIRYAITSLSEPEKKKSVTVSRPANAGFSRHRR